jgi:Uma2 family endonuclease
MAANNFLYYEEGNPEACVSPDTYVVIGVEKKRRRIYKLWEEQCAPCFVVEMSSRNTWLEDIGNKKALCAMLGVEEYFLYDPEADVVKPPLQGFRLAAGLAGTGLAGREYQRIDAATDGAVASRTLGLTFWIDAELKLHARDTRTGEPLLRPEEARADRENATEERDTLAARVRELERQLAKK